MAPTVICRRPFAFHLGLAAFLQFGDRLFQHLLVKLVTDLADMAGLFVAQNIAGAANIEIVAGQLETGAERVERLQHFQPPLGGCGQHLVGRQGHQRVGAGLGAPHPPRI